MPRLPRYLLPAEGIYHVTARGVARSAISRDDDDRRFFLVMLEQVVRRAGWTCHVFCLMPNHYHVIVETLLERLSGGPAPPERLLRAGVQPAPRSQRPPLRRPLRCLRNPRRRAPPRGVRVRPSEPGSRPPLQARRRLALERLALTSILRRMPNDDLTRQVALVTGGGRGIGAGIARELARAGARVAVAARTREQVEEVAREIDGLALEVDVTDRAAVERMVEDTERGLGPIDLLVANAGINNSADVWEGEPDDWWRVLEVNVLGVYLSARAVIPGMLQRGRGRIVVTGSGAAYLPGASNTAYTSSKAAVARLAETLAESLRDTPVRVFLISPGLVQTEMTDGHFPDDAPWTPPELAPRLVRVLASGRADELAGRYIHAEHDNIEDLIRRADEVRENDLNAIRLRR
jgi:3-oxoacyl-[acyl-carrier protein] reductase